jgi:hypothetical protein
MTPADRRYERLVCAAVVAVFAAVWVIVFALGEPPERSEKYVMSAVLVALVATPWVFAVRLLWRAWWARTADLRASADGPARLLSAALGTLPRERSDWGAAMAAELAHVHGRSARWRFAAGCTRTAVFPPRSSRVPVLVAAALSATAALAAALGVGHALPALQVFATTFVALVGALATLAVARSRRVREAAPGPTFAAAGVAGVAACIAVTAHFLLEHPTAAKHLQAAAAVAFAVSLAGSLWVVLTPPRGLATSRRARGIGAVAALAIALGCLMTSRWTIHTMAGPVIWLVFAPAVISFGAGVQAALWTTLVGTLLTFALWLPEAGYRYGIDARLLLDGERGRSIDENLDDALRVLATMPVLPLPLGVIGAALGRRLRRRAPLPTVFPEGPRC